MRLILLAAMVVGAVAVAAEPQFELFVDRGDVFARGGSTSGLAVGMNVTILGDTIANTPERRRIGTATVMEVFPSLARLNLDDAAKNDKAAKKFATVEGKGRTAAAPAAKAPPPSNGLTVPPPPPPDSRAPSKPAIEAGELRGHAWFHGAGRWKLLGLFNDSAQDWTRCSLRLPGNLVYELDQLRANDHESIALSNFKLVGAEKDIDPDFVTVKCVQGTGIFRFPND